MANPAFEPSEVERKQGVRAKEHDALDSEVQSSLQMKINRQRIALNRLQRRVINQRLVLHTINELGRELTIEEWKAAKEQLPLEKRDAIAEDMQFIGW